MTEEEIDLILKGIDRNTHRLVAEMEYQNRQICKESSNYPRQSAPLVTNEMYDELVLKYEKLKKKLKRIKKDHRISIEYL